MNLSIQTRFASDIDVINCHGREMDEVRLVIFM